MLCRNEDCHNILQRTEAKGKEHNIFSSVEVDISLLHYNRRSIQMVIQFIHHKRNTHSVIQRKYGSLHSSVWRRKSALIFPVSCK